MNQRQLKPIITEETEKRFCEKSIEEIIGREFEKRKLYAPYFEPVKAEKVVFGELKQWLDRLRKRRGKK